MATSLLATLTVVVNHDKPGLKRQAPMVFLVTRHTVRTSCLYRRAVDAYASYSLLSLHHVG